MERLLDEPKLEKESHRSVINDHKSLVSTFDTSGSIFRHLVLDRSTILRDYELRICIY
jgi:hypothetical protein